MPIHEGLKAARKKHRDKLPIDDLVKLARLPVEERTSELTEVLSYYRVTQTLAAVAMGSPNSYANRIRDAHRGRLSVPAIIIGNPEFIPSLPGRRRWLNQDKEQGIMDPNVNAMLAVYGISRAVGSKKVFVPNMIGAFRTGRTSYGLLMPITEDLELDLSEPVRGSYSYDDEFSPVSYSVHYDSGRPVGVNQLTVFGGPPERENPLFVEPDDPETKANSLYVLNDPSAVYLAIRDIARICLPPVVLADLDRSLAAAGKSVDQRHRATV